MMLELQKPFCVWTPLGYGWTIYVSRESHLANDIWTVALEKGGGIVHLRSDQIRALPNGTLDIVDEETPEPQVSARSIQPPLDSPPTKPNLSPMKRRLERLVSWFKTFTQTSTAHDREETSKKDPSPGTETGPGESRRSGVGRKKGTGRNRPKAGGKQSARHIAARGDAHSVPQTKRNAGPRSRRKAD